MSSADDDSSEADWIGREVDKVAGRFAKRIDPGFSAVTLAITALIAALTLVLPWISRLDGLALLTGQGGSIGALPRIFTWLLVTSAVSTGLALVIRRWSVAMLCTAVSCAATWFGVLTIWSSQTRAEHAGPRIGLVIAVITALAMATQWIRIVVKRATLD